MRKAVVLSCFIFCALLLHAQGLENVIPVPRECELRDGIYKYDTLPKVRTKINRSSFASSEEYRLEISEKGVFITAASEAGLFYARQTLDQMTSDGTIKELRCCTIEDGPRFPYRGLHVDVSRHFRSVDFLKKQMDAMALFKMNRMHLHLTDAAGWRLEIDAYPRLTDFAGWRPQPTWKEW